MSRYQGVSSNMYGNTSHSNNAYQFLANKQTNTKQVTKELTPKRTDYSSPVLSSPLSNIPRQIRYNEQRYTPSPEMSKSYTSIHTNNKNKRQKIDDNSRKHNKEYTNENLELFRQIKKLQEENRYLKKNIPQRLRKKVRKESPSIVTMHPCNLNHFPTTVKQFTRHKLWRYVKFISDDVMLDGYQIKGTIGYEFITYYKEFLLTPTVDTETMMEIWNAAKDYIEEALAAKRNAVQTAIKTNFKEFFNTVIKGNSEARNKFSKEYVCNILQCTQGNQMGDKEIDDDDGSIASKNSQDDFNWFLDLFGQSIGGHKEFNKRQRGKRVFSAICTPSDEAFLIFTLERFWDNWMYEFKYNKRLSRTGIFAREKSNKRYTGMRQEGIQRFNKLAIDIKALRKSNSLRIKCEENYRKKYSNNNFVNCDIESNEGFFKQTQPQRSNVIAYTDLISHGEQQNDENEAKNELISDTMISHPQHQEINIHSSNKSRCYHNNKTPQIPPMPSTENLLRIMKTGSPSSSSPRSYNSNIESGSYSIQNDNYHSTNDGSDSSQDDMIHGAQPDLQTRSFH